MSTPELSTQVQADFDWFFYSYDGGPVERDRYREMRIAFCAGVLSQQDDRFDRFDRFVKALAKYDSEVEAC